MKLIMENWRLYEQQALLEQEFDQFFKEHFMQVDEGVIDWVVDKATTVKDTIIGVIDGIKDWTHEKIVEFVKFMAGKLQKFVETLKEKGIYTHRQARKERQAITLLLTNKHIDLGVMVLSALAKMSGGFVVDQIVKVPETLKMFFDLLQDPTKLAALLGPETADVVRIIKKFIAYREDRKKVNMLTKIWKDFGGMAENQETPQ